MIGLPVISYLIAKSDVDGEVYDEAPKDFRQHYIQDKSKIAEEIMEDRKLIPPNHILEWYYHGM